MNIIYTLKQKASFKSLVNKLLDEKIVTRLVNKSQAFNEARGGKKIAIFANDFIGIHINNNGFYDVFELDLLFDFLKPFASAFKSGVALDVGANIGNHSIYFSKYFKTVYSFEPNPKTYCLLNFNSRISDNIYTFEYGLGSIEGTLVLNENPNNMGASSIKYNPGKDVNKCEIFVKRLDDLDMSLLNINFIKIDVEGFEREVLIGGLSTIKSHQPIIVFEQIENEFNGDESASVILLQSLGYKVCWSQSDNYNKNVLIRRFKNLINIFFGVPVKWHIVTDEVVPKSSYGMLIAIPERFQYMLKII